MTSILHDEEKLHQLRLIRTENIGPITFCQLMARYGSAKKAIEDVKRLGRFAHAMPSYTAIKAEVTALETFGGVLLSKDDPSFPALLRHIPDVPPFISAVGNISLLKSSHILAIVGARNASMAGKKIAKEFAAHLGDAAWCTVSGLATGIDTSVHEASLKTGTIAVLAGGLQDVYPAENQGLYDKIRDNGVIITEAPFSTQAQSALFPKRNRIIAGMARAVVVVEAGEQSGSLRTAKFALDYNRDVCAIPGHPHDPRSIGSNHLIQKGACLVQKPEDVLHLLGMMSQLKFAEPSSPFDTFCEDEEKTTQTVSLGEEALNRVRQALTKTPILIDDLSTHLVLPIAMIQTCLTQLDLEGKLEYHPGGAVSYYE